MSTELLIALTVIEVVALVGVLALFLDEVARRLRAIAAGLGGLTADVRTVGQHVRAIGPGLDQVNRPFDGIASAVPEIEGAERTRASRRLGQS